MVDPVVPATAIQQATIAAHAGHRPLLHVPAFCMEPKALKRPGSASPSMLLPSQACLLNTKCQHSMWRRSPNHQPQYDPCAQMSRCLLEAADELDDNWCSAPTVACFVGEWHHIHQ